ncbi:MAG: glycoside hydrolase [Actinobacteria bacterium]|nr:glycoside hydrolase [Actinomycetota bacterium]
MATGVRRRSFLCAPVAARLVAAALIGGGLLAGSVASAAGPTTPPQVLPEVPVTATDQRVGPANNTPMIVADPSEPRFVTLANRQDAPDFSCTLHVSGDGGRSWLPVQPVPQLPDGAEKCYAPEVAFDREGTLYYLFVGLAGGGNEPMGAFLTTSADRGQTFSPPRQVLGPLNFAVRMAIDPGLGDRGRLHLVWLHATSDPPLGAFGPPPNPILAAYSDDGGATFSSPVQVSDAERQRVVAPALALGPDHAVHVAYYDLEDDVIDYQGLEGPTWNGTWSLVVANSVDGGDSFSGGKVVDDSIAPHERVMLIFTMPPASLVADAEGRLCAAWTDGGDPDALLRCSVDQGRGWSEVRRLNDDAVDNGRRQYLPRISMAPTGRLDAIFYDRRDDAEDIGNHVYYTFSTDEAKTFASNLRLTADGSSSQIGQRYTNTSAEGLVEFGSRLGLLSQPHQVVAAWTDTRNSKQPPGQDVFATTVVFPQEEGGLAPGTGVVLLASVGALGLVGLIVLSRRRRQGNRSGSEDDVGVAGAEGGRRS